MPPRRYPFLLPLLMLAGTLTLSLWFPFLRHAEQLGDVRSFAPSWEAGLAYAALFGGLFGLYVRAAQVVHRGEWRLSWQTALLWTALLGLPLIVTYPINAIDVFNYFWHGRLLVHYGANPFVVSPDAFPGDPYLPLMGEWADTTTPYGPVWVLVSAAVYWASRGQVALGLVLFKALGLAAHLATGYLIWRLAEDRAPNERLAGLLLWLWNPAVLFMFVIDAHNDGLMLFWLMLGAWLIRQRRPVLGLIGMTLAPLTKLIGLLALPFWGIYAWRQQPTWQQRLKLTLLAAIGMVGVATLLFLPFGSPIPLLQRLLSESQEGGSFSPVVWVILAGRAVGWTPPAAAIVRAASWLLLGGALGLVVLAWRGRGVWRNSADIFALYLLTAFRFRIWYPTWLLPWLILDDEHPQRLPAGLGLLFTSQLSVIFYGHLRVAWLGGDSTLAHLIGVPLVFAGPLWLWLRRPQ